MLVTGVISGMALPKDKTKSNPIANQKVGSSQNLWLVSSLPSVIKRSFHFKRVTSIKAWNKNE